MSDRKNYWTLGWGSKPTNLEKEYAYNSLLLKMELLSNFKGTTKSECFLQALGMMEKYIDKDGLYHYPKNYLTESYRERLLLNIGEPYASRRKSS